MTTTMNLTIDETMELLKVLKIAHTVASDSHLATDSDVQRIEQMRTLINNRQFTDTRTQSELDMAFINKFAEDCMTFGAD